MRTDRHEEVNSRFSQFFELTSQLYTSERVCKEDSFKSAIRRKLGKTKEVMKYKF